MEQIFTLPSEDIAAIWIEGAKSSGNADAQYNAGLHFALGRGVAQNYQEALIWFLKAAEQDHMEAICNIGAFYGQGMGVTQDFTEAAKWFQKAADLGDEMAERNLAICLEQMQR